MRLQLDENAPVQWLTLLRELKQDAVHVLHQGWASSSDKEIFEHAIEEDRVLLTYNKFKRDPDRRDALSAMLQGALVV